MSRRVSFADFVRDRDTRELRRAGAVVPLSPKAFRLLEILVEHQPKAMAKGALQDILWPNTFVVEKNLANLVADIREALGDSAEHPRFVRTVPRFGYAFLDLTANVPAARAAATLPSIPHSRVTWMGGRAALGDGDHIVGRDTDVELFADGDAINVGAITLTFKVIHAQGDTETW